MRTIEALELLQRPWMFRVTRLLARGEELRESFALILERFYNSMQQAVETGDPAWLDPLLEEWVNAYTQSDIDQREFSLLSLLSQIQGSTLEVARENLTDTDALTLMGGLIPVFTHASEYTARLLLDHSIVHISRDLEKANDSLQRLDKSKSNFIAIAAHELKTPLTLIEGYAAMLRDQLPGTTQFEQARTLIKGVDNGTRRLREIINDMIDVSLIDNHLMSLHFQPVWINRLVDILKQEFGPAIKERRQVLEVRSFPGWNELTFGDNERLYQALRNVFSNSVKYTPDGGRIVITGRQLPGFIEVVFEDTGIGINQEDQMRIFDKFGNLGNVSLHSSGKTKFKGGGPGLGLSISKGIIEAHGGSIWVESPGYDESNCPGSIFHVLLPVRKQPPDDKTAKLFSPLIEMDSTGSETN
jgi:signal transduction histidine kinase